MQQQLEMPCSDCLKLLLQFLALPMEQRHISEVIEILGVVTKATC